MKNEVGEKENEEHGRVPAEKSGNDINGKRKWGVKTNSAVAKELLPLGC